MQDLLKSLKETQSKMRETSDIMLKMKDYDIRNHGFQLKGAMKMIETWIDGITREIEA